MAVVTYLVRADLRRRWRAWVALILLLAVAGGVSMFAVAGWQRTTTAMDRFLAEFHPGNAIVVGPDLDRNALLGLPDVEAVDGGEYFFLVPDGPDGRPDLAALGAVNPFSSSYGTVLHGMDDARVIEGRKPDPDAELQVVIDEELAEAYDLGPGDTLPLTGVSPEQVAVEDPTGRLEPEGPRLDFEVVGIIRRPSDVVPSSTGDAEVVYLGTRDLFLTPAFHRAHFQQDIAGGSSFGEPGFGYLQVRTAPGSDLTLLTDRVAEVQPDAQVFPDDSDDTAAARLSERAIGLQAAAVLAFGLVVAVAAALLALLATVRLLGEQARTFEGLRASGLSRGAANATAVVTATVIAIIGGAAAVLIAVALSPLAPLGLARRAETDAGVDVSWLVLGAGAGLIVALVALAAALTSARAQTVARRPAVPGRTSLVSRLARRTSRVDLATGLQLEGRAGGTRTAAQLTVLLAVVGIVGSLTFASSAERLHGDPDAFGWGWDFAVGNPNDGALFERVVGEIGDHPVVGAASVVRSGCGALLQLDGRRTEPPLVAVEPLHGSIGPAVLSGRAPRGEAEVALGAVTARQLGADIGDTIVVGSGDCGDDSLSMELTGLVLFNGALLAERVGEGALVDAVALDAMGVDGQPGLVLVNRAAGFSITEAKEALQADFGRTVLASQPPDDLDALDRVRGLPLVVAAFLGVLALATLVFTLGSVLRRSRRDVAVLKAMGLRPAQARRAILVHAVSIVVIPAVAGSLLGIAAGRLSWSAITRGLGAPDLPVVPIFAASLSVPVAIIAALAVAAYPAQRAARTPASTTLRAE